MHTHTHRDREIHKYTINKLCSFSYGTGHKCNNCESIGKPIIEPQGIHLILFKMWSQLCFVVKCGKGGKDLNVIRDLLIIFIYEFHNNLKGFREESLHE